ncbi:MAG: FliI/YscN family ATPase [Pseudomonadota bacterium]
MSLHLAATASAVREAAPAWRQALQDELAHARPLSLCGRVVEARGTLVRVAGLMAQIGDLCELHLPDRSVRVAEVIGLLDDCALLMPHGELTGLSIGMAVQPLGRGHRILVGDGLLGRVLNGLGQPIDGRGPLACTRTTAVGAAAPSPLARRPINQQFKTGVRAIDALTPLGEGQRVGVFAPAGVGKSTLAGMLVRAAQVDVCVVALIGERGREVGEFVRNTLGEEGLKRTVLVASTSDTSAAERVKSASVATAIAEDFRDRGLRVLLVMDSLTRYARALREVGLASGEPPTRRGFPPSVFAALPRLLERAGQGERGSITAIYNVLVEDDDDPIAEEVRSILDGHLVLSRALSQQAQFPAIDLLASLSRLMPVVSTPAQCEAVARVRAWLAKHREIELLLQVGEYQAGSDLLADEAIAKLPRIRSFMAQSANAVQCPVAGLQALMELAR